MSTYTLQYVPPRTIVMTDAEIAELPKFAQEVIAHQRALEAQCSMPVVQLREVQNAFDRRAFLARSAHKVWVNADQKQ